MGGSTSKSWGVTHLHEHLLSDFRCYLPDDTERWDRTPINLGSYSRHRLVAATEHNLALGSVDEAIAEVEAFRAAGGRSVVDSTSIGIGRDPAGLRAVSQATGVNVVMGSGWYIHSSLPPDFADRSVEGLADEIEHDLAVGVGESGIRAGLIGEVGLSWPHQPLEMVSLGAACLAQQRTGVMLQIHPGRNTESPIEAVRFCVDQGVDPARIVMSHIERTMTDVTAMVDLARLGCVLEFDLFGQESSYYFDPSFTDLPNDAGRVRFLIALAEAGFADQLAVSQDICRRAHTAAFGGEGLDHVLTRAVPLMRRLGCDEAFVEQLFVSTPARVLGVDQ